MFSRIELKDKIPEGIYTQIESQLNEIEQAKNKQTAYRYLGRIVVETGISSEAEMVQLVSEYYASIQAESA